MAEAPGAPLLDQLVERLCDLSYRGRSMTRPEALAYARFLLPVIESEREAAATRPATGEHQPAESEAGVVTPVDGVRCLGSPRPKRRPVNPWRHR